MFKKRFEVKGQICMGCFPQCFARQLHNPINVVTTAQLGLYPMQAERACVRARDKKCVCARSFGPYYSQNYSFPWSLDRLISRQCVKDTQGHTNIHPTLHQPITVISNHSHMSSAVIKAAWPENYNTHNVFPAESSKSFTDWNLKLNRMLGETVLFFKGKKGFVM